MTIIHKPDIKKIWGTIPLTQPWRNQREPGQVAWCFFSMKPSSVAKQTSPTVTKIHYQSAYQLPLNPWLLHGWTLAKAFRRAGGAKLQMLMSLIGFLDTKNRRRPWDVQQNCWHWPMKVPFTKLEVILFQLKLSKELEGFHMEHWLCCGNLERNSMHRA